MHSASELYVADLFVTALRELVRHYSGESPEIAPEPGFGAGAQLAAFVGFSDERVIGSVVLTAAPDVARALSDTHVADAADWLGELGNQLVGRLKNKLVPHDIHVRLSVPVTASGNALGFSALRAEPTRWAARWTGGTMRALLAVSVAPGLELAPTDAAGVAEEGSLSLF
ncbi:chemotaxis protein CheX [Frigoriglobus tundricola]|uniref:Chemotaxis phosphatase CheX-like domain-containing protein n=1 Tax=Frigoriglobus tundricola TaxID=2774151 RepID=A0A6M5YTB2_9BACT|nr:chemotaxis protein CheX [Frigoriglobus tundricola]QJW96666.1 hypothetical protein FTUN_4223 [Frigoriglobus tundricola]